MIQELLAIDKKIAALQESKSMRLYSSLQALLAPRESHRQLLGLFGRSR
jgi:hypothetical protein